MKKEKLLVNTQKIKILLPKEFYKTFYDYRYKLFIYHNKLMSNLYSANNGVLSHIDKKPELIPIKEDINNKQLQLKELKDKKEKLKKDSELNKTEESKSDKKAIEALIKKLEKEIDTVQNSFKILKNYNYDEYLKAAIGITKTNKTTNELQSVQNYAYNLASEMLPDLPSYVKAAASNLFFKSFEAAKVNGLFSGRISLRTAKLSSMNVPFMLNTKNPIRFENEKYIANIGSWCPDFKLITGFKGYYVKAILDKIISGEYTMGNSYFKEVKGSLYLYFIYKQQVQKTNLQKDRILGVDLGLTVPAVCALSDKQYLFIGKQDYIINKIKHYQNERKQISKSCSLAKGGHGRKRKMKASYNFKDRQKAYFKNFNHSISKEIVEFALKNNCKYINVENLSGLEDKTIILKNWPYSHLQDLITNKAKKYDIITQKIDPAYTSQECSKCGHVHEDNRLTQEKFKCLECGNELNADLNAAINISRKVVKEKK